MCNEKDDHKERVRAMISRILELEQENLKTREKETVQMVNDIRKIILEEAQKNR